MVRKGTIAAAAAPELSFLDDAHVKPPFLSLQRLALTTLRHCRLSQPAAGKEVPPDQRGLHGRSRTGYRQPSPGSRMPQETVHCDA
jgi:hypothetical protein